MTVLETNRHWLLFTFLIIWLAIFVHITAQTAGFTDSYSGGANWYNNPGTAIVDVFTHPLSSMMLTAIILNFNLPFSFRRKWLVALLFGIIGGMFWEGGEYFTAPFWGWIEITTLDTLKDLWTDFLGSAFAVLLYIHVVKHPLEISDLIL